MISALLDYYRCPFDSTMFKLAGHLSQEPGFFRFGQKSICYGRCFGIPTAAEAGIDLTEVAGVADVSDASCILPFNPDEVIDNLRTEKYVTYSRKATLLRRLAQNAYYLSRPLLPFGCRSLLKRVALRRWHQKSFPTWPVDRTVDQLMEQLILLAMSALKLEQVPFIWFWPDEYSGCAVMTHDVETINGLRFCSSLMDLNESFGVKASFQLVPNGRYSVSNTLMDEIRSRGCEINVHDWNHDGLLFSNRQTFLDRVPGINRFADLHGAEGFRSGALYRNSEWYDEFTVSYDMSIPNVGHLDPQPGGCCTVMPFFIGDIVELPVTAVQDYMLFHLLGQYSIDLWKCQADLILERNGLLSFIVHPDYVIEDRARATYSELLACLKQLRDERNVWMPLPREVNRWWRDRNQMRLMRSGSKWRIEGPQSNRARVAYAIHDGDHLVYKLVGPDARERITVSSGQST